MMSEFSVIYLGFAVAITVLIGLMLVFRRTISRLKRQTEFQDAILGRTTAGIMIVSSERKIIEVNRRFCEMYGYTRDDLVGQSAEILHLDRAQYERFGQWFDKARNDSSDGPLMQVEYHFRCKDGGTFWAVVSGGPLELPDSDMGVVWSVTDISDRKQAEAELAIERGHMQSLFEVNGSGMLVVSSTRQILQVNNQFCLLFGYGRDELVGQNARVLHVDQQHYEDWAPCFQEARAGLPLASADYPWRRKDGTIFWCFFAGVKMQLPNGEPGVLWNVIDITERKLAEEKIKGQQVFLQNALDALTHPFYIIDAKDYTIKMANKASAFGEYPAGAKCFQLTHNRNEPCAGEDHPCFFREIARTRQPVVVEHVHTDRTGKKQNIEVHAYPIFDDDDNLSQVIEYCLDISGRKQGEEERSRLVTAIEQGVDSVVITDKEGLIQYVNPSFTRTSGYSKEEVIGKNPRILKSGRHDALFYQEMWETLLSGQAWQGHLINKKKDGTLFEEEVSITPVLNEAGEMINYVAVRHDVTEQMQLEEQLRQAQKMESIGTLAGGIAHDFNNILAAILGFAKLAKRNLPSGTLACENIDRVITSGKRAAILVQQILEFSRKTEQTLQPLQPHLIVEEVLQMLHSTLPATVEIQTDIDPACGTIMADPTKIHQIVMNLCTNAFQALKDEQGIIRVRLSCQERAVKVSGKDQDERVPFMVLSVSDTGQGIVPETASHIFEPYFTTKGQDARKGTGLGLAVVHGIVEGYGGVIDLESRPGHGSTFRIMIPTVSVEVEAPEREGQVEDLSAGTERILIVDDEPMLIEMNRMLLEDLGYTVVGVTDSREALAKVRAEPGRFDLIVTDQTLPGLTGSEFAKHVLAIDPSMPIIICTGYSAISSEEEALTIGIKKYIHKPVEEDELVRTIRKILDERNPS